MENTKRSEILKKCVESKEVVNIDRVIRKDKDFLTSEKCSLEKELHAIEDSIEDYLANPKLAIDKPFVALYRKKIEIKADLELLETISKLV